MIGHTWSVCVCQIDSPRSSLRSQHCVFERWSSPQGWRPSAASSSPTCPSVLHRWIHPMRAPLSDGFSHNYSLGFFYDIYFFILEFIVRGGQFQQLRHLFHFTTTTFTLTLHRAITGAWHRPFESFMKHLELLEKLRNTHHLHFHQPTRISGQPLGLGSADCILHPALHGRLSSTDK